jgi:hypothetical protein
MRQHSPESVKLAGERLCAITAEDGWYGLDPGDVPVSAFSSITSGWQKPIGFHLIAFVMVKQFQAEYRLKGPLPPSTEEKSFN